MPTARFFKLKEEKRNQILQAAVEEFSQKEYEEASISGIIKRIPISRGSFYTYFEDKEDVFRYVAGDLIQLALSFILDNVEMAQGNLPLAMEQIFQTALSIIPEGKGENPLEEKPVLPDMQEKCQFGNQYQRMMLLLSVLGDYRLLMKVFHEFTGTFNLVVDSPVGLKLQESICSSFPKYRERFSREEFRCLMDLLISWEFRGIWLSIKYPVKREAIRSAFWLQLEIFRTYIDGKLGERR